MIHVDPDGTRWVGVELTPNQFARLQDKEALARFAREVSKAFWREWGERVDREAMGLANGLGAKRRKR